MVKSIFHEANFAERLVGLSDFDCGVLLSGTNDDNEYLLLPIRLPLTEGSGESTRPNCIKDIDEKWVASHCRNLGRMIPGGIRVSGMCIVTTLQEFTSDEGHVKTILAAFPNDDPLVNDITGTDSCSYTTEKIVLLVDPSNRKFTGKVLDTSSTNNTFRSIPVKERPFLHMFKAFKTHISLSLETVLPAERKREEILQRLQSAIKPYLHALLTEANLLINGEFRQGTELVLPMETDVSILSSPHVGKSGRKSQKGSKRRSVLESQSAEASSEKDHPEKSHGASRKKVITNEISSDKGVWADVELTIFGPQFPRWQRASSSSSLESAASSDTGYAGGTDVTEVSTNGFVPINRLVVNGRIPGIAFLPANTTADTLFQSLRKDLIQSILTRLELLTDELHITSAELEVPRMLLPQRVLVRLPSCPSLPLSDYKFLSETADDVVARLHYFCVPLGMPTGAGDTGDVILSRASSVESHSGSESPLGSRGLLLGQPTGSLHGWIDASCLDTSLERSPEASGDEYSEVELLESVTQSVKPASQYLSLYSPLIWIVLLLGGLGLSFLVLSSWNAGNVH